MKKKKSPPYTNQHKITNNKINTKFRG